MLKEENLSSCFVSKGGVLKEERILTFYLRIYIPYLEVPKIFNIQERDYGVTYQVGWIEIHLSQLTILIKSTENGRGTQRRLPL